MANTSVIKQLTEEQTIKLSQFRQRVSDCQLKTDFSDHFLVKWLIARNYKVDEAESMLRRSLDWRRLNRVDEILDEWKPSEVITKYYSFGQTGTDKFGCPLWISAQGLIDMKGILLSTPRRELSRYMIYIIEESMRQIRSNQNMMGASGICVIADMEHLSMKQVAYKPAIDHGKEQAKVYEDNYPEHMRRIFIINAPKLYTSAYTVFKPLLPRATVEKIRMFGCDKREWSSALLDEIDADQLPVCYGGSLTDPDGDPQCPSKFNRGGEVPHSYYMSNLKPAPSTDMATLTIGGFSKKVIDFEVTETNSILKWKFMTQEGDLAFRVYQKNTDGVVLELVPLARVESHLIMEEGQIVCDLLGKYFVEFDNTFSYLTSKKLYYTITVDPPVNAFAAQ